MTDSVESRPREPQSSADANIDFSRRDMANEPLIVPLQSQDFDEPDVSLPGDGLLFPIYRRLLVAIQDSVRYLKPDEALRVVDDLLLIETRLDRARTRAEQRTALNVLQPVKASLQKEFEAMNFTELTRNLERLLIMLAPAISRMPLRLGNKIYVALRFRDYDDLTVKLSLSSEELPTCVIDELITGMMQHKVKDSSQIPAEDIIAAVAKRLGSGPPYTVMLLTPSEDKLNVEETSKRDLASFEMFLSRMWENERTEKLCTDCWWVRKDAQEDILAGLIRSTWRLRNTSYDMINDLLFP